MDFHGWHLPLQFGGILQEHAAVRSVAGLFDVSHMGKIHIHGADSAELLDRLSPNTMAHRSGAARYTHLLREDGTILDDVIVTCLGSQDYFMVCNGGPREAVLRWLHLRDAAVDLKDLTMGTCCMALQGPAAARILQEFTAINLAMFRPFRGACIPVSIPQPIAGRLPVETEGWGDHRIAFLEALGLPPMLGGVAEDGEVALVTRTGYTGEDGFEIICPGPVGRIIWDGLLLQGQAEGLKPCGLGARDSLRLEMGYLLSGQDFDGGQTTLETGYDWIIKWDHPFIGSEALERQRRSGEYRRWVGLLVEDKGIPRSGQDVFKGEAVVGRVTSGTLSPTLGRGIAMAYLEPRLATVGGRVEIAIRERRAVATVVKPPFIPR